LSVLRIRIVLFSAAAVVIATAGMAGASLFLIFDRASGPPGTVVHVMTGGEGACVVCPPRMPLFFAHASTADGITAPDDSRLVRVGELIVDEDGNGSGVLTVPDVPIGRYMAMTFCEPCAPDSAGRSVLPLGPFPPFEVLGSSVERPAPIWPWIGGGLLGILAATLAGIRVRRRLRRPPSPPATADPGNL
jgi:hypothetical protein